MISIKEISMRLKHGWVFAGLILILGVLACNLGSSSSTATISGTVWHDLCALPDGPLPNPAPQGCVVLSDGGARANGVYETGEPGIPGVKVTLFVGACNSATASSTVTDSQGHYSFENVAVPGAYCILIDAISAPNDAILIPGEWTFPLTNEAAASASITLDERTSNIETLDFGWDYQFMPAYTEGP
jgi:hypothetical protein